ALPAPALRRPGAARRDRARDRDRPDAPPRRRADGGPRRDLGDGDPRAPPPPELRVREDDPPRHPRPPRGGVRPHAAVPRKGGPRGDARLLRGERFPVKSLPLVLRTLLRNKRRSGLTAFAVAVSVFLVVVLRTALYQFETPPSEQSRFRLVARHATSLQNPL